MDFIFRASTNFKGVRHFVKPSSYLNNERFGSQNNTLPIIISSSNEEELDQGIEDLKGEGYTFLNG